RESRRRRGRVYLLGRVARRRPVGRGGRRGTEARGGARVRRHRPRGYREAARRAAARRRSTARAATDRARPTCERNHDHEEVAMTSNGKPGLLERLEQGPVICAEGYLFECERRGYLQAGAFVPEVVLEHPEVVTELHREFVHAGSDVVEAFTYYGHREKLRIIGKEHLLEALNRRALELARDVADESGALLAGDLSNTNLFSPDDESRRTVRAMFEEQAGWAAEGGVDFIIAETFSFAEEALIALDVVKETGLPAVVTL